MRMKLLGGCIFVAAIPVQRASFAACGERQGTGDPHSSSELITIGLFNPISQRLGIYAAIDED